MHIIFKWSYQGALEKLLHCVYECIVCFHIMEGIHADHVNIISNFHIFVLFLAPQVPKIHFDEIGPYSMNVSYKPPNRGPAANFVSVRYYKKGRCF